MLKYLIAFLLVMHGLAHVTGLLGLWTSGSQAFADAPWIFPGGITPRSVVGRAWGLLWLAAAIGLIGAGLGMLFAQAWWPSLAVAAAGVSLIAIVPWLRVVPPGAWAGALLDLLIVVVLLSPWAELVVKALH
jgi:hypothetical protein